MHGRRDLCCLEAGIQKSRFQVDALTQEFGLRRVMGSEAFRDEATGPEVVKSDPPVQFALPKQTASANSGSEIDLSRLILGTPG
jgi:hypothetical protein